MSTEQKRLPNTRTTSQKMGGRHQLRPTINKNTQRKQRPHKRLDLAHCSTRRLQPQPARPTTTSSTPTPSEPTTTAQTTHTPMSQYQRDKNIHERSPRRRRHFSPPKQMKTDHQNGVPAKFYISVFLLHCINRPTPFSVARACVGTSTRHRLPNWEGAKGHTLWSSGQVRPLCTESWLDWQSLSFSADPHNDEPELYGGGWDATSTTDEEVDDVHRDT